MSDPRLIDISLDEDSIFWRNDDAAQERRVAIYDLLEGNHFAPIAAAEDGYAGPFQLQLGSSEGRLILTVNRANGTLFARYILGMMAFRRAIRDYHAICESYFQAVRSATPAMIETIDMARRGIHNAAAEQLMDKLVDKITLDFDTARRLFTLIAVLHIKG